MSNILDLYQKQVESDKKCQDYATEGVEKMSEEEFVEYKKQVDELREKMEAPIHTEGSKIVNKSFSYDEIGREKTEERKSTNFTENELKCEDIPLFHGIDHMEGYMRKAYCPHCGGELEGVSTLLYNPFNFQRIADNVCKECGAHFTLEYAYPRFVVKDIHDNNEINIHF